MSLPHLFVNPSRICDTNSFHRFYGHVYGMLMFITANGKFSACEQAALGWVTGTAKWYVFGIFTAYQSPGLDSLADGPHVRPVGLLDKSLEPKLCLCGDHRETTKSYTDRPTDRASVKDLHIPALNLRRVQTRAT